MNKICPRCEKEKDSSEFYERRNPRWESERYQSYCKACVRERTHEFYLDNRDRLLQKEKERKLARHDEFNEAKRTHRKSLREKVIAQYGGRCECCGENRFEFLAIDHIEGGGKAHIKSIKGPHNFVYWLIKNNYPSGFRILCHNCNMAYGIYKRCPHKYGTSEPSNKP